MLLQVAKYVIATIPTEHTIPKTEATNCWLVSKCTAHIRSGKTKNCIYPY